MTSNETDVIDYDSLVAEYNDNLTKVLRAFRPAAMSFLDMWVPDEDIAKSVLNLVETAEAAGLSRVVLFLGSATVRDLDVARLVQVISVVGTTDVKHENGGLLVTVSIAGAA